MIDTNLKINKIDQKCFIPPYFWLPKIDLIFHDWDVRFIFYEGWNC